jgi:tetratricopeptide (TPR) repeat protein
MKGQADEAIAYYKTSLAIRPNDAIVQGNLGNALFRKRQLNEAVVHYRKALEINPDNTHLLNILARVLAASPDASIRNGAEAVELAQRADRLSGGKNPRIITTLAAADAEAGQFPEAVMTAQRALELAAAQTNAALVETLRLQIGLYRANLPFRDPSLTNAPSDQERSK